MVDYSYEQARLDSFTAGWSCEHVHPADLAAAGFYWTGEIDRVRCFECRIEICRWEEGDDVRAEHQRWGGRCRFICNRPCGNVPIGGERSDAPHSVDVTGRYDLEYRLGAVEDRHGAQPPEQRSPLHSNDVTERYDFEYRLSEVIERFSLFTALSTISQEEEFLSAVSLAVQAAAEEAADTAEYRFEQTRLASFTAAWSTTRVAQPAALAAAGFYWVQELDVVRCFMCRIQTDMWELIADPMTFHASYASRCAFVRGIPCGNVSIDTSNNEAAAARNVREDRDRAIDETRRAVSMTLRHLFANTPSSSSSSSDTSSTTISVPTSRAPSPLATSTPRATTPIPTAADARLVSAFSHLRLSPTVGSSSDHEMISKACCETCQRMCSELVDKCASLENIYAKIVTDRVAEQNRDLIICKVCLDEEAGAIFLPCGHVVACITCAKNLSKCPICRKKIYYHVRAYLS